MNEKVKIYTTTSGMGTVFQVGLNYVTIQPGHDFLKYGDHLAAMDAVLKEAVWAMEQFIAVWDTLALITIRDEAERNFQRIGSQHYQHAKDFLGSQSVGDFRKRQEQP